MVSGLPAFSGYTLDDYIPDDVNSISCMSSEDRDRFVQKSLAAVFLSSQLASMYVDHIELTGFQNL